MVYRHRLVPVFPVGTLPYHRHHRCLDGATYVYHITTSKNRGSDLSWPLAIHHYTLEDGVEKSIPSIPSTTFVQGPSVDTQIISLENEEVRMNSGFSFPVLLRSPSSPVRSGTGTVHA